MWFVRLLASFVFVLFPIVTWAQTCTMFDDKYNIIEYDCIKPETIKEINAVDKNGNTALCRAVISEDVNAYLALKANGANVEHKCINNIPKDKYESFLDKVALSQSSSSFLGLNKHTWAYMGLGTVGVIGAVAAMGMGGGSGGGSGAPTDVYPPEDTTVTCKEQGYMYRLSDMCPEGWIHNSQDYCNDDNGVWFKCDQKAQCGSNYYAHSCPYGYEEVLGDMCISGNTVYKKCIPAKCDGYKYYDYSKCPDGWEIGSSCLSGETKKYKCDSPKTCPGYKAACENGYEKVAGSTCLSGDNIMFKCQPASCDGYEHTDASECPAAWQLGSSCKSGTTTKYKCDKPASCEGYDYDSDSECPSGWEKGSSCQSGNSFKYMCDKPASCTGYQKSCSTGYEVVSGDTCLSGTEQLVKCAPAACEGFNYTTCPQGWDPGASCLSGNTTKYKCDVQHQCQIYNGGTFYENSCPRGWIVHNKSGEPSPHCYSGNTHYVRCVRSGCSTGDKAVFLSCDEGWHQVSNPTSYSCTEYGITYSIRCEPNSCSSDYRYTSSYKCPEGWELGSSCKSGDSTRKYKCDIPATCPYTTTSCTGAYIESGNQCKSGNTIYKECTKIQCNTNETWSPDGCVCKEGYERGNDGTCSLIQLDCGNNATQQETQCVCNKGFTQFTIGYGCYPQKDCGVNAHQEGTECICDAGFYNFQVGVGCKTMALDCGANAHQAGMQCVCNAGYEKWQEGIGCSQIILNCGENAKQIGNGCVCDTGYINWTDGIGCYKVLNCGLYAHQQADQCRCDPGYDGWVEGLGCFVRGINDTLDDKNVFINSDIQEDIYGKQDYSSQQITVTNNAGIYINKDGAGNVYGIDTKAQIANSSNSTEDSSTSGTIYINKLGYGNVFGIRHFIPMEEYDNEPKHIYNSYSANGMSSGVITILNNGNGNLYGMTSEYHWGELSNSAADNHGNSEGIINIYNTNNSWGVYGIYHQHYGHVNNAYAWQTSGASTTGRIYIDNISDSTIYGIYGYRCEAYNVWGYHDKIYSGNVVDGEINISNVGDGDLYGIYGGFVPRNNYSFNTSSEALIKIQNVGNGDVIGLYGDSPINNFSLIDFGNMYTSENLGQATISINNTGNGNVYGLYGRIADEYNNTANAQGGIGIIDIANNGIGNAYGMYGAENDINNAIFNSYHALYPTEQTLYTSATGVINLYNYSTGRVFGMYGKRLLNESIQLDNAYTESIINIQNLSSGSATGLYTNIRYTTKGGEVINSGTININNVGTGTAIGIFGDEGSVITNSGVINISRDIYLDEDGLLHEPTTEVSGDVFGIYAKSGSTVINSGNINIVSNGNAYGIYTEGDSTVTNTGTISLNGVACSGAECNTGNYIVLNGSTLVNAGTMSADTLSLNSMGGTVRAATGSRFVATDAITGDLNISSELVSSGNQTTYVAENMIDAGDVSGLNLVSESALFNARLASNGHDVVMTMRGFDEFTDNKSLAAFLERNYATGNNTDLFGDLKNIGTNAAFMGALNGFSGLGAFNQFANEDLAAMREMNFSMNEQLFENSGRDDVNISGGVNYFSFSNQSGVGSGSYGLSIDRISDKWKMGYGMSMANISTGNDDGINRQNTIGLFYMPMTYTDSGYEVIVNPKIGFSRGEYNRQGFNNMSYEGYIEKRIFGLMNDIRYPLTFGNWTVAPNLGLNAIVYNQSGHEENKMYGLIIPDSNLVSVEAGLGLYAKYDRTFADNSKLSFNTGLMAYREFGDCYNIKLGIRGMDGTFDLYDNNLYDYRGAATIGFKYNSGRLNLYGNAQYFTDSDSYMNLKAGIRFAF